MLNITQATDPETRRELLFGEAETDSALLTRIARDGQHALTSDQAGRILKLCRYPGQVRDLTPGGQTHIRVLADMMSRGEFRDRDTLSFAIIGGRILLLNGHHRLSAQKTSGVPILWNVVVYECSTQDEVEKLYASFDTNVRDRSERTILNVLHMDKRLGVSKATAAAVYEAVPLISSGFALSRTDYDAVDSRIVDRRLGIMVGFAEEARTWENAISPAPAKIKRLLSNQGPVAIALITLRDQPIPAFQFWNGLAKDDGLRTGDPRKTYLGTLNNDKKTTRNILAHRAAIAWRAWLEGRKLAYIRTPDVDNTKLFIAGTQFGK